MVDFGKLTDRAKKLFADRGGAKSASEDANELKDIAGRDESTTDKAKDAASAIREPGAGDATGGDVQPPA